MNLGNNKCNKGKRYKFKMEKQGSGWRIEQSILNSALHSLGRTKGLVDVAGLGDTTGQGSFFKLSPFGSVDSGLVEGQRRLMNQCHELAKSLKRRRV